MKKLIAIDGNSLMHRAYYALPSMTTRSGVPTGAIYGFLGMLLKLIERKPDYLLVAFDVHGKTFRHDAYPEYKTGRRPTPDDLREQFPLIKRILQAMGVTICECERFEADDILGTFSRKAGREGVDSLLVTGDRDALQLIDDKTHVLLTVKGISETIEYDIPALFEKYKLPPERMIDLKGLMGDSSDNIPGIPGVGEVTALKLLEKYGSMEEALAHAEDEKGALRQRLVEHAQLARLSYRLGIIDTEVPIFTELKDCRFDSANMAGAVSLMNELELRSLISRLPGSPKGIPAEKAEAVKAASSRIAKEEELQSLVRDLAGVKRLALRIDDTFKLAAGEDAEYEIVLGATLLETGLTEDVVFRALKPLLESESVEKLVFDLKRIKHVCARYGTKLKHIKFDAMIADYLLNAIHPADSLQTLCAERLGAPHTGAAALFTLEKGMMGEMEQKGLVRLYHEVELPLASVLFAMEQAGFAVDNDVLLALADTFGRRIDVLADNIQALAGETFNIQSTKQLADILFNKLHLPPVKKTKSGYSTDVEVLEKLEGEHPIIALVMEYRTLTKLKSTFVDGLMAIEKGGRIHTSFNQNVAVTGRISSAEPNLQNIPVKTELGREIRKAFVASEGNVLVGADYSQIELRLLAHMGRDARMIEAFNKNLDIHRITASEVFSVPFEEVAQRQRNAAKAVNFGIVYGISDYGLAKNLGISRKEAKEYIEMYLSRYPGVRRYMQESVEKGKRDGYAQTLMGRRRELPELQSSNFNTRQFGERVAMNMPIQGSAADIIKLAMVRVHDALLSAGLHAKLILQIHDELIIDTPLAEAETVAGLLKNAMENVIKLDVPLLAEVRVGKSWFDTK